MTEPTRDPLDQAIDRVAARLVSVDHDASMAERIVARLPERSGWGDWPRVLAPQAALAAVLIGAVLVWTMRGREEGVRNPAPSVAEAGGASPDGASVPGAAARADATVNAPRLAARRVTPAPAAWPVDHERSLAPVDAPVALEVVSLASPSLPDEAFVVLAPIVLTELPLSGESISPR